MTNGGNPPPPPDSGSGPWPGMTPGTGGGKNTRGPLPETSPNMLLLRQIQTGPRADPRSNPADDPVARFNPGAFYPLAVGEYPGGPFGLALENALGALGFIRFQARR